jgi:hypothetical protein
MNRSRFTLGNFKFRNLGLWFGVCILVIGLWLNFMFYPHAIATETINLLRDRDRPLIGRLYIPERTAAPFPTIMLWHGVSSSKELVEMLAMELARHGIAALSFDSGGFGESYPRAFSADENLDDARVVFAYVKQHPERFDPARLGMGGHSMGAATAIAFASETIDAAKIRVTLDLGMSAEVTPTLPANLFMGIGLYEEFHTPDAMREMLQLATGEATKEFQLKGDFKKGSARKLVISPTSNHLIEPFDPTLIQTAVEWSIKAFDLPVKTIYLTMPFVMWGWLLTLFGTILSVGYGVIPFSRNKATPIPKRPLQSKEFRALSIANLREMGIRDFNLFQNKLRFVVVGMIAIAAIILCLGMTQIIPAKTSINLILLTAVILPVSTYAVRYPQKLTKFFRMTMLYIGVILIAYSIVAVISRFSELVTHPTYLFGLPQFILQIPVGMIYSRTQEFTTSIFPSYSNSLVPSWQLTLLFLPELVYPSLLLGFGTRSLGWLIKWLRQPLKLSWSRPSNRSLQLVGGLCLVLTLVLIQQARMGVVSLEYAIVAVRLLFHMALLPAFLIIIMMRSAQFQKLENFWIGN